MRLGIQFRLGALALASALMGALMVALTLSSQREAAEAEIKLGRVDIESFRIADLFKEKLRYANDKMRRYASFRESGAWEDFVRAADGLRGWISTQSATLPSPREQQLLRRMNGAWETYMQK